MKARALLLIGLALCPPAFAQLVLFQPVSPNWAGQRVGAADVVVDAIIRSVRPAGFEYRNNSGVCGYIHEATVRESFKGDRTGNITFATQQPLAPESRQLLLLRNLDDFTTGNPQFPRDSADPDFNTSMVRARASCMTGLPPLKTAPNRFPSSSAMLMIAPEDGREWFVLPDIEIPDSEVARINVPQTASALAGSQRQAIPWTVLRKQILDYKPAEVDFADRALTLEQANAAMQSSLDRSLRESAGKRGLAAAIRSSQKARQAFVQANCTTLTSVPDIYSVTSPPEECRRQLTQLRARELASLAYGQGWYEFRGHNCDDACWKSRLDTLTEDINSRFQSLADGISLEPEVKVSFKKSRKVWKTWEAWARASCRMVTTRWPERSHRDSLLNRCHWQALQMWERIASEHHFEEGEYLLRRIVTPDAATTRSAATH